MAARVLGDKYRLVSLLGEGGMGAVWRAEDLALGRSVAVKFIREERLTEETRSRFLREARIAASIQHRNIIRILDYGTDAEGCPFLVMELLEGQSLQDLFQAQSPTPTAALLSIMGGVLAGLEAVHGAGIVHRDLKPENVFLAQETDAVIPKLLDFGISRPVEGELAAVPGGLTNSGALVGTPYYMSPEQVQGDRTIDARSDLWSVGVILYEALTGVQPFTGASLGALVVQIATGDVPLLSARRPDLPAELVAVVSRAMARRREDRFESARALRHALLAAGGATPVSSDELRATTKAATAIGAGRRLPLLAGLTGILVLAAAAAVLWTGAGRHAPTRTRPSGEAATRDSAPPRASEVPTVTVRLRDVPAAAEIRVDGARQSGPVLSLARDDRRHVIEVTAPGTAPWRVEHEARGDGDYRVQLASTPPVARPEKRDKAQRPPRGKNGLPILGDPGF